MSQSEKPGSGTKVESFRSRRFLRLKKSSGEKTLATEYERFSGAA
jgi:hypothetical protein